MCLGGLGWLGGYTTKLSLFLPGILHAERIMKNCFMHNGLLPMYSTGRVCLSAHIQE